MPWTCQPPPSGFVLPLFPPGGITVLSKCASKHCSPFLAPISIRPRRKATASSISCTLCEIRPEALARAIPILANFEQTRFYFGDRSLFLDRVLHGTLGLLLVLMFGGVFGRPLQRVLSLVCIVFPVLVPWFLACRRNAQLRAYPYAGLLRGRVLAMEVVGAGAQMLLTVEGNGVGGRMARVELKMPREENVGMTLGDVVELIVFAKSSSFSNIVAYTDMLLPRKRLFLGFYPYLRRKFFVRMRNFAPT